MYSINKNDELNKDISACKEAIQIIQNSLSNTVSNDIDMDFDEEYFKIDKSIMSIDSYKEVYPFLKEFKGETENRKDLVRGNGVLYYKSL